MGQQVKNSVRSGLASSDDAVVVCWLTELSDAWPGSTRGQLEISILRVLPFTGRKLTPAPTSKLGGELAGTFVSVIVASTRRVREGRDDQYEYLF